MKVETQPGQVNITPGHLGDLQVRLEAALDELSDCERAESEARSRCTAARNNVNGLQKQIDTVIEAMRKNAPRSTDWADQR